MIHNKKLAVPIRKPAIKETVITAGFIILSLVKAGGAVIIIVIINFIVVLTAFLS